MPDSFCNRMEELWKNWYLKKKLTGVFFWLKICPFKNCVYLKKKKKLENCKEKPQNALNKPFESARWRSLYGFFWYMGNQEIATRKCATTWKTVPVLFAGEGNHDPISLFRSRRGPSSLLSQTGDSSCGRRTVSLPCRQPILTGLQERTWPHAPQAVPIHMAAGASRALPQQLSPSAELGALQTRLCAETKAVRPFRATKSLKSLHSSVWGSGFLHNSLYPIYIYYICVYII